MLQLDAYSPGEIATRVETTGVHKPSSSWILAGAELFTGNILVAMAWASRRNGP